MRELIKRDWRTLSGVMLFSVAVACMGWSEDDQAMSKQSSPAWFGDVKASLQSATFESDSKLLATSQKTISADNVRMAGVVAVQELARSEYCNGRCEQGDQILQMALQDPINRLPLDAGERAASADQHKGRVARVQFYMHERYSLPWHKGQLQTMCQWAAQSPVDGWELERNRKLTAMGSVSNPFVDMPEQVTLRCRESNA